MSAKAVELGAQYQPPGEVMPYAGEANWPGPGLWVVQNGETSLVGVKHSKYRPAEAKQDDTSVYSADMVQLVNTVYGEPYVINHADRLQGAEAELNAVDRDGEPFNLYPDGQPLTTEQEEHPELFNCTLETDKGPYNNATQTYRSLFKGIEQISYTLRTHRAYLDPASAYMYGIPTREDATPNPYVQTMVDILGDGIMKFIGNGIHEHFDAHVGYLPVISRLIRPLAPYLNLGLLAAPFAYGEQVPTMSDYLNQPDLRKYDGTQPQSVRYLTRYAASRNGGVGLRVVHDSLDEALLHAHEQMRDGLITSPSRHLGSHADVRNRYDPPAKDKLDHPGRLELCVKDTAAMRIPTLIAYSELVRALVAKFESVAAAGEAGLAQLHADYPGLFGPTYDKQQYAEDQLEFAHLNSIVIAYHGAEATVRNGLGQEVSAREQFTEIIRLAQDGNPERFSPETIKTLHKSILPTEFIQREAGNYLDQQGLPSLRGYYETGYGTPAQWMILRANAARMRGTNNEADLMRIGTQDRTRSFGAYLLRNAR